MTKKRATPADHPYSSFDAIGPGNEVHLRFVKHGVNVAPEYADAKLQGQPSGNEGEKTAEFYVPTLGRTVKVSEVQYVAWTRYSR